MYGIYNNTKSKVFNKNEKILNFVSQYLFRKSINNLVFHHS
jgi:hypothetical protein